MNVEKKLQKKISKEFGLDKAIKEESLTIKRDWKEYDKWLNELCIKNGTTKY